MQARFKSVEPAPKCMQQLRHHQFQACRQRNLGKNAQYSLHCLRRIIAGRKLRGSQKHSALVEICPSRVSASKQPLRVNQHQNLHSRARPRLHAIYPSHEHATAGTALPAATLAGFSSVFASLAILTSLRSPRCQHHTRPPSHRILSLPFGVQRYASYEFASASTHIAYFIHHNPPVYRKRKLYERPHIGYIR